MAGLTDWVGRGVESHGCLSCGCALLSLFVVGTAALSIVSGEASLSEIICSSAAEPLVWVLVSSSASVFLSLYPQVMPNACVLGDSKNWLVQHARMFGVHGLLVLFALAPLMAEGLHLIGIQRDLVAGTQTAMRGLLQSGFAFSAAGEAFVLMKHRDLGRAQRWWRLMALSALCAPLLELSLGPWSQRPAGWGLRRELLQGAALVWQLQLVMHFDGKSSCSGLVPWTHVLLAPLLAAKERGGILLTEAASLSCLGGLLFLAILVCCPTDHDLPAAGSDLERALETSATRSYGAADSLTTRACA